MIKYLKNYNQIIQAQKMGCIGMIVHPQGLKISEDLKKRYRQAIAKDNILGLVNIPQEKKMPANLQISQTCIEWSAIHFCCRYDSAICLDYLLKKSYIQSPEKYIQFVNSQTGDKNTCLHLCAIWKSIKCFYVLVNYGGLNLKKKNSLHKSAEDIASQYGCKEMKAVLKRLKKKYGVVTQWRNSLLQSSPDINIIVNHTIYQQKMQSLRMIIQSQSQQGILEEQEQVEAMLLKKTKNLLLMKRQKLYKNMRQIQIERNKLIAELQNQVYSQIIQYGADRLQEGQKIDQNIKSVEEQIEEIKIKMQIMECERHNLLMQKEQRKVDTSNPDHLKRITQTCQKFEAFRQKLVQEDFKFQQSLSQEHSIKISLSHHSKITHQSRDAQGRQKLSTELLLKYNQAKIKGVFKDSQFPCSIDSLGGKEFEAKTQKIKNCLVWLKPNQFLNQQFSLFNGIQPNDIKQGQLGICYCLATISKYAQKPKKIKQIFYFYDLALGFYVLKFYTNGKINYILIDDFIPCHSETNQPLFSKPIGNQIWVLLIQKAWAKIIGSYFATEYMTPDFFMEDLTGSPSYGEWFKSKSDKTKDLQEAYLRKYMIVLTSGKKKIHGIVNNHAYSLLKIIHHNDTLIYKVRNPWGRFQWNGMYGQDSSLWDEQLIKKCEYINEDDGVFFLSESQLLQAFQYYSIGMDELESIYSYIEISSQKDQDLFFKFELIKPTKLALRFTQLFKRIVKDKNYNYSPVIIEIGKITSSGVQFMSQGNDKCSFGQKSVYGCKQIFKQFDQGQYFIRLRVQWNDSKKYNTGVLSIYCDETVQFQRLQSQQGQKLWQKLLLSYVTSKKISRFDQNIVYSTVWMRGQLVCYCAVLNENDKLQRFKVSWYFNQKELENCRLSKGKVKQDLLQCCLSWQKSYAICTLQRINIGSSCKYGTVSIKSLKS